MGRFRRVVTGHRADGTFTYPDAGREPPQSSWFPPPGGERSSMHRWKNPHDEPCRVIGAIVGACLKNE